MKIILLGGCNWLGRNLIEKLLLEKEPFHMTWVDNLSSEYSSRHFTWDYEYLKGDCYDFIYGDVTNYTFIESIMTNNCTVIYNIWRQPDCILAMDNICELVKKYNSKLIYTTPKILTKSFERIINNKDLKGIIGIEYVGELIGDYSIWNKRDAIETIEYYKKIGNPVTISPFEYYTMESATQFIYFFIIQPMEDNILIKQPTKLYP